MTAEGKITAASCQAGTRVMITRIRENQANDTLYADPSLTKVKNATAATVTSNWPGRYRNIEMTTDDGRTVIVLAAGHQTFWLAPEAEEPEQGPTPTDPTPADEQESPPSDWLRPVVSATAAVPVDEPYAGTTEERGALFNAAKAIGYTDEGAGDLAERAYYVGGFPGPYGDECDKHPAMRRYDTGECEACEVLRQHNDRPAPPEEPTAEQIARDENTCPQCGTLDDGGPLPHCPPLAYHAPAVPDSDEVVIVMTVRVVANVRTWVEEYGGQPGETRDLIAADIPELVRLAIANDRRRYLLDDVSVQHTSGVVETPAEAAASAAYLDAAEAACLADVGYDMDYAFPPFAEACM